MPFGFPFYFRGFLTLIFRAISIFNLALLFGVPIYTNQAFVGKGDSENTFQHSPLYLSSEWGGLNEYWQEWVVSPNSLRYMIHGSLSRASSAAVVIHVIFYADTITQIDLLWGCAIAIPPSCLFRKLASSRHCLVRQSQVWWMIKYRSQESCFGYLSSTCDIKKRSTFLRGEFWTTCCGPVVAHDNVNSSWSSQQEKHESQDTDFNWTGLSKLNGFYPTVLIAFCGTNPVDAWPCCGIPPLPLMKVKSFPSSAKTDDDYKVLSKASWSLFCTRQIIWWLPFTDSIMMITFIMMIQL